MTGFEHLIVPDDEFTLEKGVDSLSHYTFGTGTAEHLFCVNCGVKSFYRPRSHPDGWSLNFRCIDQAAELNVQRIDFDGRNWEAAKRRLG